MFWVRVLLILIILVRCIWIVIGGIIVLVIFVISVLLIFGLSVLICCFCNCVSVCDWWLGVVVNVVGWIFVMVIFVFVFGLVENFGVKILVVILVIRKLVLSVLCCMLFKESFMNIIVILLFFFDVDFFVGSVVLVGVGFGDLGLFILCVWVLL